MRVGSPMLAMWGAHNEHDAGDVGPTSINVLIFFLCVVYFGNTRPKDFL